MTVGLSRSSQADQLRLALRDCSAFIESSLQEEVYDRFGTSPSRRDLLRALLENPDGCRMGRLAGLLGLSAARITSLARQLERSGLAEILPAADDGRSSIVRITPLGGEQYLQVSFAHDQFLATLFRRVEPDRSRQMQQLLVKLHGSISHEPDRVPLCGPSTNLTAKCLAATKAAQRSYGLAKVEGPPAE